MLVAETQIFKFRLDLVQSQSVGDGRIDIERFSRDLVLLVGRLRCKRAHVVESVTDLNEDHTDVIAHREQQLLEVLGLRRGMITKDAATDLGKSIDDLGDLLAKDILNVLGGIVSVLHNIMEQSGADARRTQSHLLAGNLRHSDRMHDIGLARQPSHAFMSLAGEVKRFGDDVHLLSMGRSEISVQQMLEGIIDHLVVSSFALLVFLL